MTKPTLCLDFDGVIHSYTTQWKGPEVISDPPTPGCAEFLKAALEHFKIVIYSARSSNSMGLWAMKCYMVEHFGLGIANQLDWADRKPHAFLTIDDRAYCFTGTWPDIETLLAFKPWNRN